MKKKFILLAIVSMFMTGCATVKYQSPPPIATNHVTHEVAKSDLLAQTNHTLMHLNQSGDILYQQNFGGGGAGVGILLGPIGVMANTAAIKSNTEDDVEVLKEKLVFNPSELLKRSTDKHQFELTSGNADSIKLSPYIYVSKTENEQLLFASALIVETEPGKKSNWLGKYMYQTSLKMAKSDIADGVSQEEYALLKSALENGFDELIRLYSEDRKGSLKTEQALTFISDFVSPRFNIEMVGDLIPSDANRVNIRTVGGIYSLPRDSVEVKFKK
ncbi:hypothetical protein [Gayadomonas joobiniege]|uniref:hypothetical protein n=1 Tax=Gayadomonas joobiniege TaxID=1234606 RepID=UPI00036E0787|nr:hypothetical protein [Gayadomonas joobiniege]